MGRPMSEAKKELEKAEKTERTMIKPGMKAAFEKNEKKEHKAMKVVAKATPLKKPASYRAGRGR